MEGLCQEKEREKNLVRFALECLMELSFSIVWIVKHFHKNLICNGH